VVGVVAREANGVAVTEDGGSGERSDEVGVDAFARMGGTLVVSGRRFVFVPLRLSGLAARTGRGVREDIAGQGDTFEG
jgi:hypothetical protein